MADTQPSDSLGFTGLEALGGLLLIGAAALALVVANSPLAAGYHHLLDQPAGPMTIGHWIDDALMALFFLGVGLEVKHELHAGELSHAGARLLPVAAAAAGMAAPALVYLAVTAGSGHVGAARGWAIPAATDIAFAQAVLLMAARGLPCSLRLFLTTVAVVDDIGAVAIIALAYTGRLDPVMLAAAAAIVATMLLLNRRGIDRAWPYLLLGGLLWVAIHRSGVHATVAGVLTAATIPARAGRSGDRPLAERMGQALHPWTAFLILPLFGFANAGVTLGGLSAAQILAPVPVAITLALLVGKQAGVGLATAAVLARVPGARPRGATTLQLYGVALLAGIGFTMSLFIGRLAFPDPLVMEEVRLGVLGGSILSALAGFGVLRLAARRDRSCQRRLAAS